MTDAHNRTETEGKPSQTPSPVAENLVAKEGLLGAIDGTVDPVRKPIFYFVGLFFVAVAMVILPLIYLAIIVVVGSGLLYHATENTMILTGGGNIRVILLSYFGPLVVGLVVMFFMVKPLFARPPKRPKPFSVEPNEQPLLFEYVERLSKLVRAPLPKRIDVDCNVNASAGFRRGWISMIGNDLVLTIGLPLVEGMTVRQLTGVLAHELGHFSQGGGMRLSYVIRSVNHWFARLVYERDSFDVGLEDASRSNSGLMVLLVVNVARLCVWLTRRILWVLMTVGHFLSCFLLRQMEFDADRYEARLSGSAEFEKTGFRLTMLTIGGQIAQEDLGRSWEERKLPDQYALLVASNADAVDEDTRERIRSDVLSRRTRWLDTHPADADRVRSAKKENAPGLVQIEPPAQLLFDDYAVLSRAVTVDYYKNVIGAAPPGEALIPTESLLDDRKKLGQAFAALERFFQGHVTHVNPVFPSVERVAPPADAEMLLAGINEDRQRIQKERAGQEKLHEDLLRNRLQHSLQLLHSPAVSSRLESEGTKLNTDDIDGKLKFLRRVQPLYLELLKLHQKAGELMSALQGLAESRNSETLTRRVLGLAADCRLSLETLETCLRDIPYPYEHTDKDCTCERFAGVVVPPKEEIGAIVQVAGHCAECMIRLYMRVIADLALAAETAETAAGLEPLPEVPEDEEPEKPA